MSASIHQTITEWRVTRQSREGEPVCTLATVDGRRLQVYRHIARPKVWTAYAYGVMADVVLTAARLDEAQREAVEMLERARSEVNLRNR